MAAALQELPKQLESNDTKKNESLVIELVFKELGRPRNLFRVDANHLWGNRYRVNVYCSTESHGPMDVISITDSFHVQLEDGAITCNPSIARKYE